MENLAKISRVWAMPSRKTFSIKPIEELINRYLYGEIIDPFANDSKFGTITNDIDPSQPTTHHMGATEFLKMLDDNIADVVLCDPPYSPRQVSECYRKMGMSVNMQTTQSSYWAKQKTEIARITKNEGIVITCGWNSGGIGKKYGFLPIEYLLVSHGGWHNDTIVTVETLIG